MNKGQKTKLKWTQLTTQNSLNEFKKIIKYRIKLELIQLNIIQIKLISTNYNKPKNIKQIKMNI